MKNIYIYLDKISKLGLTLVLTSLTFIVFDLILILIEAHISNLAVFILSLSIVMLVFKISSPYEKYLKD